MKAILITLFAIGAATIGWLARPYFSREVHASHIGAGGDRKISFYQSAMHPWVKSDKPGRCTICGMQLTPVYEGDTPMDVQARGAVVTLTQSQIQVLHVETIDAKVRPLTRTLQVAGTVDDDATRHRFLSAYVDGRVDKLYVNFMGAEVAEGQPLAEFYSPVLLQAEREYRQLTGDLRKNAGLRLRQMGLTASQIDALEQKPGDALTSQILSSMGGTVVGQSVFEGQYVTAGERLFEIADFSTMWFQFRAYEQDLPWLEIGQAVTLTTPSQPGKSFEGTITFIDPNFEEATRSTKVRVELANPLVNGRRLLLHRLYADGMVKVDAPAVLTLPRSAVIETGPEAVVYVDAGGGAYARGVITVGRRGDRWLEVLSGVKEGDRVVTNGNLLIDGQSEMDRAFMSPIDAETPPAVPSAAPAGLGEVERQAIREVVSLVDAMAAALAADDLAAFNRAREPARRQSGEMIEALRSRGDLAAGLETLNRVRDLHGFDDLPAARHAFLQFSTAAVAVLEPLRKVEGVPAFDLFECRMVDQAIPDAPRSGRWVQVGGRPGHNPFFGKEMLDCATEIKP